MSGVIQRYLSGISRNSKFEPDIRIAAATQGWMSVDELKWLGEQAHLHERIVEVGSYLGRSTRALGDNTNGVVYAIDNFEGVKDMTIPAAIRNNVWELFVYNVGTLIEKGTIIPVLADHATANVPITPDMVFIDGDHSFEAVMRDIELWLPRMQKRGLLCGHDIQFEQVKAAVRQVLTNYKVAEGTTIWYVET